MTSTLVMIVQREAEIESFKLVRNEAIKVIQMADAGK